MTREQKIQLLEAVRAGTLPAEYLEPVPDCMMVLQEPDGFYRFENGMPPFGLPENMTAADYGRFKEKLTSYREARRKIGMSEPILLIFEEKKTY
jgi:hypothetical protein